MRFHTTHDQNFVIFETYKLVYVPVESWAFWKFSNTTWGDQTKWYGQNGIWTKWYWTICHGKNGADKMV